MVAIVTKKHEKNQFYGFVDGFGMMIIDTDKIAGPVKKGDKFDGYKAGGSFIATKRAEDKSVEITDKEIQTIKSVLEELKMYRSQDEEEREMAENGLYEDEQQLMAHLGISLN